MTTLREAIVRTTLDDVPETITPEWIESHLDGLNMQIERLHWELGYLHTWDGLISTLDRHYPPDIVDGSSGDPGPRLVVLLREVAALRRDNAIVRAQLAARGGGT